MIITFGAVFITTSVSTETPAGLYGGTTVSQIYNLGMLQRQMMVFVTGLAIAVSGVVLTAAGVGIDTIGTRVHPALAGQGDTASAVDEVSETVAVQRELTPAELSERDRDLNRATFMVAGVLVAVIGAVFLFVLVVS
ncbi:hypothetical protein [Sphingomonas faeni]|uniref:hypothetical protein n=1 Tax=Sphingomonas faeni TaxID=185950 RepID=UPI0011B2022F|nr:hypothetical protein [Sphingomonas faeni]